MTDLATWRADCFFAERGEDGRTYEKCHTIYYLASATAAVAEAVAWIENRQREVPEWFGMLLALKVYAFTPSRIGTTGQYTGPTGFCRFAWKCDQGKVLPQRI